MVGVRKIFGCILLIMAVYFLSPLLGEGLYHIVLSLFLIVAGLNSRPTLFARVREPTGVPSRM